MSSTHSNPNLDDDLISEDEEWENRQRMQWEDEEWENRQRMQWEELNPDFAGGKRKRKRKRKRKSKGKSKSKRKSKTINKNGKKRIATRKRKRKNTRKRMKKQRGGGFNDAEKEQIKNTMRGLNIPDMDEAEINAFLKRLDPIAQSFAGPYLAQLIAQMASIQSKQELDDFINDSIQWFESEIKTDDEYSDIDD
jgi:ribosome-binding ATPase YchF (GTP1/OBG family)